MKILLWSWSFYPNRGGIETMTELLGREFTNFGHTVTVITRTKASLGVSETLPFEIVREPSWYKLIRLVRDCDIFLHNHLSLNVAFPLLVFHRPWVIIYQTWYPASGLRGLLQPFLSRFATNVAISRAVAEYIGPRCLVIPNAYDNVTFHELPDSVRRNELVFVGRLVPDKGVQVLLDSLALLRRQKLQPHLTIIGDGPHREALVARSNELGLTDQVDFIGQRTGKSLAELMNAHQILVVPSLWNEPFGIVALEGIACGCIVVGSEGGGLGQAIGPCGVTFPNGNATALAETLRCLLQSPETWAKYRKAASSHLSKHTPSAVAKEYLDAVKNPRSSEALRSAAEATQD